MNNPGSPRKSAADGAAHRVETEAERLTRRRSIEESGGKLVAALFSFAQTLLPETAALTPEGVERFRAGLKDGLETDADGSAKLTLRLPAETGIEVFARTLASFAALMQKQNDRE